MNRIKMSMRRAMKPVIVAVVAVLAMVGLISPASAGTGGTTVYNQGSVSIQILDWNSYGGSAIKTISPGGSAHMYDVDEIRVVKPWWESSSAWNMNVWIGYTCYREYDHRFNSDPYTYYDPASIRVSAWHD